MIHRLRSFSGFLIVLLIVALASATGACGLAGQEQGQQILPRGEGSFEQQHPPTAPVPAPRAPLTQLVILGDSVAAAAGVLPQDSFDGLLLVNDDLRYPDFTGKDLAHRASHDLLVVDLAAIAATSEQTVRQATAVPPNPVGHTLVIMSVGINDFREDLRYFLDRKITADRARIAALAIDQIARLFSDRTRYPHGYTIGVLSWYDPTDGIGRIPWEQEYVLNYLCSIFALLDPEGNHLADNMRHYNAALARHLGPRDDVVVIDLHQRFLGHGVNHDQQAGPHYRPEDPSRWILGDCLHPNPEGHDQIRRAIWETLIE